VLSDKASEYWIEQLEKARIPCAPVNKFSQALSDEQVLHRKMVVDLAHPDGSITKGPGNPIKLSRSNQESYSASPSLGQDTDDILKGLLNKDPDTIALLREKGVIN
jgi:crotonobetainyl-CoA:carnitine CoA-transferase CaiB-like acyl-CoA transferase